ncbi:MAG: GIY-YIG nuclease family protein [Proteobacteria bacterium]|nr:GIY-YIG nuclease family protein [Pseudomonadota bacterium]
MDNWLVYLLKCSDSTLYCGVTNNLEKRLNAHKSGKGSKYVRAHLPFSLVATSSMMSKSEAMRLEYIVKQVPKENKIEMVTHNRT